MGLQRGLVGGNQARMGPWQAPAAPTETSLWRPWAKKTHMGTGSNLNGRFVCCGFAGIFAKQPSKGSKIKAALHVGAGGKLWEDQREAGKLLLWFFSLFGMG